MEEAMKNLIAALCLTILASPAWAWEPPQSGGVAIYQPTLAPSIQKALQEGRQPQQPQPQGQALYCYTEHCGIGQAVPQKFPQPQTCYTEHCHGPAPQQQTQAATAGRFAKR
jgi:hypothetical protein